jgi:hypothetical protein
MAPKNWADEVLAQIEKNQPVLGKAEGAAA